MQKLLDPMKGMKETGSKFLLTKFWKRKRLSKTLQSTEEEYDIEEDVNALLGGEELSEEFRQRQGHFRKPQLVQKSKKSRKPWRFSTNRNWKKSQGLKVSDRDRVDSYLEYVCEEWMTENELSIEHGLKTEMTESFLSGMKGLFEEHYVTIPEDKYDVLESMVGKLDDMETKLNEEIDKNIGLNKRLAESTADSVLSVVSEGLMQRPRKRVFTFLKC